MTLDDINGIVVEKNCAVAIGFEIDPNVKSFGGMMKMFDTSGGAINWQFHHLLNVLGRGTIRIGSLDNTNFELVANAGYSRLIRDEVSCQGCDSISVK